MDLVSLRTFQSVIRTGSFSAAAGELGCVQSNVTARIRRLEETTGAPLFERGRGGARLTALGQRLHGHAEQIIARVELAERDLKDAVDGSAPLRLGAMESTAAVRLPPVLKRLGEACPNAPLSLRTGPTDELLSLVLDRQLDAAFVAAPIDEDRFRSAPAFREKLVVVKGGADAPDAPLLAFRSGCGYRGVAEAWLRGSGRIPLRIIEMGSLDGILGCVAAGMGFAVVPESTVRGRHGGEGLVVEDLPAPFRHSETRLAWRHDHRVTQAMSTLVRSLAQSTAAKASNSQPILSHSPA